MKYPFIAFSVFALIGCSVAKYDIDISCKQHYSGSIANFSTDSIYASGDDPYEIFSCLDEDIIITCDRETVQFIGDTTYCTTKDKKSVRITITR